MGFTINIQSQSWGSDWYWKFRFFNQVRPKTELLLLSCKECSAQKERCDLQLIHPIVWDILLGSYQLIA